MGSLSLEDTEIMIWNHSLAIGLAKTSCTHCKGAGMRPIRKTRETPCKCTFRGIFRACYGRFRDCVLRGPYSSGISMEFCRGREGQKSYSRKREEYMADFCLVSRRMLTDEEYRIFRFHFLLGADWRLCCQRLKMDRGLFFHAIYRIEQKLGKAFVELEPYALFPLSEYFSGSVRRGPVSATHSTQRSYAYDGLRLTA
jgi:hypothetical protein